MGNFFPTFCCCTECQTAYDLDHEEGRRKSLQYNEYRVPKPPNIEIIEKYIEVPSGFLLFTKCYMPAKVKPKGVVFYVYGFAECVDRVATHEKCITFANAGYITIVHDHKGHGRSDGLWLYVKHFDQDFVDNANFIHNYCKDLYIREVTNTSTGNELFNFYTHPEIYNHDNKISIPWTPADLAAINDGNNYFLLGESMGGAICCKLAMDYASDYKGMALLAPMVKAKNMPNKFATFILELLLKVFPRKEWFYHRDFRHLFVKNQEIRYKFGDRTLQRRNGIRLQTVAAFRDVMLDIEENMEAIQLNMIVVHGLEDPVTSFRASKELVDRTNASANTDATATLITYKNAWHQICSEPFCAQKVFTDIIEWFDQRL